MPLGVETIVIHFVYEIMREAGLRMPQPLGHAVSIVGALVIGRNCCKRRLNRSTNTYGRSSDSDMFIM